MRVFKKWLLACVVVAAPGVAMAADIAEPPPEPVPAPYAGGWYLRGDIGWSWLDWDGPENGNAITGGGGFGYKWNEWVRSDIRADFTGSYDAGRTRNERLLGEGKHDLSTITVLGNSYIDFPLTTLFRPYIGAGIGYGWTNDLPGRHGDDDGFAWAAYGGASFDINPSFAIDVGYRFRMIDVHGPNVDDHSVLGGLRWTFGAAY